MSELAACAFCSQQTATATMEMTGLGWRCITCAARAEIAVVRGEDDGRLAEHLNRDELEGVSRSATIEAAAGGAITSAAAIAAAFGGATGAFLLWVFGSGVISGVGMLAHGLHRRRQARAAIDRAPDARVISK